VKTRLANLTGVLTEAFLASSLANFTNSKAERIELLEISWSNTFDAFSVEQKVVRHAMLAGKLILTNLAVLYTIDAYSLWRL
jgi:hypothetical protein